MRRLNGPRDRAKRGVKAGAEPGRMDVLAGVAVGARLRSRHLTVAGLFFLVVVVSAHSVPDCRVIDWGGSFHFRERCDHFIQPFREFAVIYSKLDLFGAEVHTIENFENV